MGVQLPPRAPNLGGIPLDESALLAEPDGDRAVPSLNERIPLVITTLRRAVHPIRDGGRRVGAIIPLDPKCRAAVGRTIAALGWTSDTALVLLVTRDCVVVSEGGLSHPELITVRIDARVASSCPRRRSGRWASNRAGRLWSLL